MKKKISKRKEEERREQARLLKKRQIIVTLSIIPPFLLSIVFTVLYALKTSYVWLTATTSLSWFALGGLFVYSLVKKWGYVNAKGVKTPDSGSIITVYNTVLVFALALFFLVMTLYKIF